MNDAAKKRASYDRDNTEAARIILADVAKYGGENSLMVSWARAVQRNLAVEPIKRVGPGGQRQLFESEAA